MISQKTSQTYITYIVTIDDMRGTYSGIENIDEKLVAKKPYDDRTVAENRGRKSL